MKEEFQTIDTIVKRHLCHACGACAAICPEGAIVLTIDETKGTYLPAINKEICTECRLCFEICSGKGFNYKKYYHEIFGRSPMDPWLGNYEKIVTSNAADSTLRFNASSGGSLTALLITLLEDKIIDGALVTRFDKSNPLIPETFIARNKSDLLDSIGSKYCPVPVNRALKQIADIQGKYAFVGLPCHIQSLRMMQSKSSVYRERIKLIIGLMCSHTNSFKATEYFLIQKGICTNDIASFSYRGNGWTGSITIHSNDNSLCRFLKSPKMLSEQILLGAAFNSSFVPERCLTCCDHMAEFADIVFGDPRLPEYIKNEHEGKSLAVIRTNRGMNAYRQALLKCSIIDHISLECKSFYQGQNLSFKKGFKSHLLFNKIIGRHNPFYEFESEKETKFSPGRILLFLPSYFTKKNMKSRLCYYYVYLLKTVFSKKFYISQLSKFR